MKLRELEGELTRVSYGEGLVLDAVFYLVPSCNGLHGHVRAGEWVP